jgi:hypothetical protein
VEGDEDSKVPLYADFVSETRGKEYEDGHLTWYDLEESCCYFSLGDGVLFEFKDSNEGGKFAEQLKKDGMSPEDFMAAFAEAGEPVGSFRVVTENVPRNFIEALRDKVWGEPARKEMELLKDKVIMRVSSDEARKIREAGCDIVRLFPIYEEKLRDGVEVRKVRLVADGRTHTPVGPTYDTNTYDRK